MSIYNREERDRVIATALTSEGTDPSLMPESEKDMLYGLWLEGQTIARYRLGKLDAQEMATLQVAVNDEEGRIVTFETNMDPLSVITPAGQKSIVLGEQALNGLVKAGLFRFDGGSSYLITSAGRMAFHNQKGDA